MKEFMEFAMEIIDFCEICMKQCKADIHKKNVYINT